VLLERGAPSNCRNLELEVSFAPQRSEGGYFLGLSANFDLAMSSRGWSRGWRRYSPSALRRAPEPTVIPQHGGPGPEPRPSPVPATERLPSAGYW
jgi:hypothetical protein